MTRIIAGTWRSRRLEVPKGRDIRPTTDRMRERLFSMLGAGDYPPLDGAVVADLFAGTGALGLEALSRGAQKTFFVEKAPASLACLKANIAALGAEERAQVIRGRADRLPPAAEPCDVVFMDPPYREDLVAPTLASLKAGGWYRPGALLVVELASDEAFEPPADLELANERIQGQQRLLFLRSR